MSGNLVSCPRCGGMARVVDGVFNARGTVAELVSGPTWTREVLQRLDEATSRARSLIEDDPIAAVETIAAADPSLRQKAWEALGSGQLGNFIAALALVAAFLLGRSTSGELTPAEVEQIVSSVIEQTGK